ASNMATCFGSSRRTLRPAAICIWAVIVEAISSSPASAAELSFVQISTAFSNFDSLDYFEPTNGLVAAAYYPNGTPHNFRKIAPDGTQTQYASINGKLDEVKVVTARSPALGGYAGSPFAPGTMFAGNGGLSQIIRINPDGTGVWRGGILAAMPNRTGVP